MRWCKTSSNRCSRAASRKSTARSSGQPEEHRAQQRPLRQVEGLSNLSNHQLLRLPLPLTLRVAFEVHHGQGHFARRSDVLDRTSLSFREGGAQRLMALHHLLQTTLQGLHVERARKAYRHRHVEHGAALAPLLLKPHPLLRK